MKTMYQQITLIGNLGNDPEMRYTPSGVPVTTFNVAVNRRWTNQDGQQQDKTIWFRVTAWRKTAELASQYLTKGRQVLVVGEVEEARAYIDRDGNPRGSLEVTANNIKFIGGRGDSAMPTSAPAGGQAEHAEASDEDIPF
jgi:single-strand DNA-binding protein